MDFGKKCLLMAIAGAILAFASSPFVISMASTGKPFIILTPKEVLNPHPPVEYWTSPKIITGMEKIMAFYLNPARGEQYRVSLNVVSNGTVNAVIFRVDSTDIIQHSFNAGNHTLEDLGITVNGTYVLNATSVGSSVVNATFRVKESWLVRTTEWEEQVDLLRTLGPSIGFATGLVMMVYSLIMLRREAGATHPRTAGERGYIEVEEE